MLLPTSHQLIGLCFGVLTTLGSVRAQTSPAAANPYSKVPIASPTAASLGKFVDVPVNYHTGVPQISVPLYTIKEGSLSLPLSLSYHAGGVKVQEPAGWVGTGWALNAGGVITRTVIGAPDESGTSIATKGHFSDYGYSSYLTIGAHYGNSNDPAPNGAAFASGLYDGEPDLFFFNFNGYSGKFYFSDDRTPVVVDGQDLKIEYYYPGGGTYASSNIQGFIITVPTGDKYYFGSTDNILYNNSSGHAGAKPVEMSYTDSGASPGVDNNIYSSYYLSKIVAADGVHTIQLTYQGEQYSYYTLLTYPVENPVSLQNQGFQLATINIDGVRLASISFSTGSVTFNAATTPRTDLSSYLFGDMAITDARALDNIQVASSNFCKQFSFTYSYFGGDTSPLAAGLVTTNGATVHTDQTRLKLDRVVEKSCDGTVTAAPWQFTYNGTFLPRRLSFAQDHWGFYNGVSQNSLINTLIPSYYAGTDALNSIPGSQMPGANRDPDAQAMAAGILTQVTYPTGGTATFAYEPHDVWVSRKTTVAQQVYQHSAGSGYGQNPDQYFNLTFSGNYYKFTLDYQRNFNDRYDGTVYFFPNSSTLRGLGVGEKNGLLLKAENVQAPPAGTISCEMHADVSPGNGEGAQLNVYEYIQQVTTQNTLVGGLRIKTTTLRETPQVPGLTTTYSYKEPTGHSSGTLFTRPRYVQVVRNDDIVQVGYASFESTQTFNAYPNGCINPETVGGNANCQRTLVSPASILPLTTTQGNHIGYSRVTVTRSGNGRTEYQYFSSKDQELNTASELGKVYDDVCYRTLNACTCDRRTPSLPAPPARFEFNRGQLASEVSFSEQGQLLKMRRYNYLYDSSRIVTPAWLLKTVAGALLACHYERRGYWKKQTSVVETAYSNTGQPFVTSQLAYYESPYHHQLTRQLETGPSGEVLETRHQYALDFAVPACTGINDGTTAYNRDRSSCSATYGVALSTCQTMGCKYKAYIDQELCLATARVAYVAYRRANFINLNNVFQLAHDAAKNNADASLRPLLQLQDDGRLEVIETSRWRNNQLLDANYTTFGPGLNQPTILYPARQFSLSLAAPSPTFTPAAISGNLVQRDTRYATTPETTLAFDQGALVQVLSKTGIATSYLWGYQYTLPVVKAVGVRYTTLQGAYASVGNNLTTLRSAPALARALLTTYTHQPLVGMLSQTDPTGRPITYEYDGLGRLVRTRDEQNRILGQQQYHYAGQP